MIFVDAWLQGAVPLLYGVHPLMLDIRQLAPVQSGLGPCMDGQGAEVVTFPAHENLELADMRGLNPMSGG